MKKLVAFAATAACLGILSVATPASAAVQVITCIDSSNLSCNASVNPTPQSYGNDFVAKTSASNSLLYFDFDDTGLTIFSGQAFDSSAFTGSLTFTPTLAFTDALFTSYAGIDNTFRASNFALNSDGSLTIFGGFSIGEGGGTMHINLGTAPTVGSVPGVPEPATWAMMLLGFGGIGFAMRPKAQSKISMA